MSGLFLELGPVADQSFVGGSFAGFNTTFYAGVGNYSTIFTGTFENTLDLYNVTTSGQFPIQNLYFGQTTTTG